MQPEPDTSGGGILANAAFRAVADVVSKLLSFVLYFVMAHRLGAAKFGVFGFGLAVVTLVTTLGDFGQNHILTREVARDRRRVDDWFANTVALRTALAVPALGLMLAIGTFTGFGRERWLVVALLGLAIVLDLATASCAAVYQAWERLVFLPAIIIPQRLVTAGGGIAALLLGGGLVAVATIYVVGSVVALGLALAFMARFVVRPRLRLDPRRWWPMMRLALPVGLNGVFATVLFRIDTVMLAIFASDRIVGRYSSAYRLLEATLFVSWAIGGALFPVISRLTRNSDPPVAIVLTRGMKLALAITLPAAAGAAALARPLLELIYGADFGPGATALAILAPTIALYPVGYLFDMLLISQDLQRITAWVMGLVALENVLANLVLIPWLSLEGAALSTSISQVLLIAGSFAFAGRAAGPLPWARIFAGPLGGALTAGATMWLLRGTLGAAIAAGIVVHLAVLAAIELRWFPEDARVAGGLLRRLRPAVARGTS